MVAPRSTWKPGAGAPSRPPLLGEDGEERNPGVAVYDLTSRTEAQ